jgi:GNAT superfamily N-acetyltransferase
MKLTLRQAIESDRDAVRALCELLNPQDYLPATWDAWLSGSDSQMLVAQSGEILAGCLFAATVASGQAFSQGLRVHPDYRRLGVGTQLMKEQQRLLRARNIRIVRGVTGVENRRARTFFESVGWKEIATIRRRRMPQWSPPDRETASQVPHVGDLLVSREGAAHFRRIFFVADTAWLEQRAGRGCWHARDGAHALLDPVSREFGTWVVALGGPIAAIGALLRELSPPWRDHDGLTVEAADQPELQSMLDGLGFQPPGPDDSYVVVESGV